MLHGTQEAVPGLQTRTTKSLKSSPQSQADFGGPLHLLLVERSSVVLEVEDDVMFLGLASIDFNLGLIESSFAESLLSSGRRSRHSRVFPTPLSPWIPNKVRVVFSLLPWKSWFTVAKISWITSSLPLNVGNTRFLTTSFVGTNSPKTSFSKSFRDLSCLLMTSSLGTGDLSWRDSQCFRSWYCNQSGASAFVIKASRPRLSYLAKVAGVGHFLLMVASASIHWTFS